MTPLLAQLAGTLDLLAYFPFITPLKLPSGARLWLFLPLALCVATVYRATRARSPRGMLWPTLTAFANIVIGMALIALALFIAHEVVLRHF